MSGAVLLRSPIPVGCFQVNSRHFETLTKDRGTLENQHIENQPIVVDSPKDTEISNSSDQGDKEPKETSTTLLLIRHGKTPTTGTTLPGRAPGLHLSEEGAEQANQLIGTLRSIEIDAVLTSPLERAKETAQPLCLDRQIEAIVDQRIIECDFGDWTGRRLNELSKLPEWRVVQAAPSKFRFPNGESFREMSERMIDFLDFVHQRYNGKTVAAFTHADPVKALIAHCLGLHLDAFQKVIISTAGVSAISITNTSNYALYVNTTAKPNMKVS